MNYTICIYPMSSPLSGHVLREGGGFHAHRFFPEPDRFQDPLAYQLIGPVLGDLEPLGDLRNRQKKVFLPVLWSHQRPLNQERLQGGQSDQEHLRRLWGQFNDLARISHEAVQRRDVDQFLDHRSSHTRSTILSFGCCSNYRLLYTFVELNQAGSP